MDPIPVLLLLPLYHRYSTTIASGEEINCWDSITSGEWVGEVREKKKE